MPDSEDPPILILSFNRPDYLTDVLQSLLAQRDVDIAHRRIFLVQDGGRNHLSGNVYCDEAVIAANVDMFRRLVPHGTPLVSPVNLSVALNQERAERLAFEELRADAAIMLEDDFVLGPYYLKVLHQLLGLALTDERIGYVAAYGDHWRLLAEHMDDPSLLTHMSHNWAFGLTRRQWLRQRPFVDAYLALVRDVDYRLRPSDPIIDLFHSWGLGASGTSQDIAKSHACYLTGAVRMTTMACYGHYIGRTGLHFTSEQFDANGYADTPLVREDRFRLVPPDAARLWTLLDAGRQSQTGDTLPRSTPLPGVPRPSDAPEGVRRVRDLIERHQTAEAETLAVEWLARAPGHRDEHGHPAFLKELLRIALARGQIDRARELGQRLACALPPADPCVHVLFARAYQRLGAPHAARLEWHAVLARHPGNAEAQAALAAHP